MGRVIVVGSINVDLVHHLDDFPQPGETVRALAVDTVAGGKGANQAVAAAAAGAEVVMVGCVGADEDGERYRARLAALGIDTAAVRTVPGESTGVANILLNADSENIIVVVAGANGHLALADAQGVRDVGPGDIVLLQLEIPLPAVAQVAQWAHEQGARVIVNIAPYAELPAPVLALADPIIANEHEARKLADSATGAGSVLVTLGAHGAIWDGESVPAAPVPGEVVDTTGAGDAFAGALAAALAAGAGRADALTAAAAAGAAAVATPGAQPDALLRPRRTYA